MEGDPKQKFLFSGLYTGREGAQCERSLSALSFLFHGWAHYKGKRKLHYGNPDNGILPIIEFEKLALFWCRLWGQLWKLRGVREERICLPISGTDTDKFITFPPPFVIERAKHGKRPQRYDGATAPVTLAEIVLGLQELGIRYFDVHPYVEDGKPLPNDYRTEVHATLPPERRTQLLSQFSTVERTCLDDIDNIVRHLGIPEIRALGTHEDLQETMGDIELEFDHIIVRLVPRAVTTIETGSPFLGVAQDMLEYASEAHKKSCTERKKDYESAYDQFQNDIKDPLLREGFRKCQALGAQIWDAPQMEALARRAKLAWAIAKTLAAVAYFGDHPEDRDQQRSAKAREMKHVWDEGITGLREYRVSGLPSDLGDVYVGGNHQLTPVVRDRLLEVVGLLKR